MRNKDCLVCQRVLTRKQYWKLQKYCSRNCASQIKRKFKFCPVCNKLLTTRQRHQKFCSKKCWALSWSERMRGHSISLETRKKISEAHKNRTHIKIKYIQMKCPVCKNVFLRWQSYLKEHRIHFCSIKCKNKWAIGKQSGVKNPNWRGGISQFPYPWQFNNTLKEKIRKQYQNSCQLCSIIPKQKCSVHHIDYNKQNLNIDNLIALCRVCNSKVNFNRNLWQSIFQNRGSQIGAREMILKGK